MVRFRWSGIVRCGSDKRSWTTGRRWMDGQRKSERRKETQYKKRIEIYSVQRKVLNMRESTRKEKKS